MDMMEAATVNGMLLYIAFVGAAIFLFVMEKLIHLADYLYSRKKRNEKA